LGQRRTYSTRITGASVGRSSSRGGDGDGDDGDSDSDGLEVVMALSSHVVVIIIGVFPAYAAAAFSLSE